MKVEKFIDTFQSNITFYIENNRLISTISQLTGFCMKCNSRLNGLKAICLKLFPWNNCCSLSLCSFKKEQSVTGVQATSIFSFYHGKFLYSRISEVLKKAVTAKTSRSYELYLIKLNNENFIISLCIFTTLFYKMLHFRLNSSRKLTPGWETFERH